MSIAYIMVVHTVVQFWCIHKSTRNDCLCEVNLVVTLIGQNDSQRQGNRAHMAWHDCYIYSGMRTP